MRRRRSPIAIDFGVRAVTMLQAETCAGTTRIRAAAREPLASTAASDRAEAWFASAQRLLRSGRFRGGLATTALGLDDVSSRHVRVPFDALEHAGERILAQVQGADGGDDDVVINPVPVADFLDQGERKREFLCCIVKQAAIDARIALLERLKLRPCAIELAPLAQARALLHAAPGESFAHLDIGAAECRITFVRAGQPLLVRSVPVAGEALQATLEERLGLDITALAALGNTSSMDAKLTAAAITDALAEPLERLAQKLAEGIRYCGALFQGRAVTSLRATGRLAQLPGLMTALGRRIGLRSEATDPLAGVDAGPLANASAGLRSTYATTLGLCLAELAA